MYEPRDDEQMRLHCSDIPGLHFTPPRYVQLAGNQKT